MQLARFKNHSEQLSKQMPFLMKVSLTKKVSFMKQVKLFGFPFSSEKNRTCTRGNTSLKYSSLKFAVKMNVHIYCTTEQTPVYIYNEANIVTIFQKMSESDQVSFEYECHYIWQQTRMSSDRWEQRGPPLSRCWSRACWTGSSDHVTEPHSATFYPLCYLTCTTHKRQNVCVCIHVREW